MAVFLIVFFFLSVNILFIFKDNLSKKLSSFDKPEWFFLLNGTFFGILMVFLTPPFQVPDEPDHFFRAFHLSELNIIARRSEDGVVGDYLPESLHRVSSEVMQGLLFARRKRIDIQKNFSLLSEPVDPNNRKFTYMSQMSLYSPVPYIPQVVGITLAKSLNFSVLSLVYMGRLCNLFTCVLLIYLAIRITPVFKYVFFLLALTPISLFQSASLSADGATNSLSFLIIAIFLRHAFDKETHIEAKDIGILFLLAILISLCKQVYFFLIFMFLLIPIKKFSSKKKYFITFSFLIFISIFFSFGWIHLIKDIIHVNIHLPKDSVSPEKQLEFIISNPFEYFKVIIRSLVQYTFIESFIGQLGWRETRIPEFLTILYFIVLFSLALIDKNEEVNVTIKDKIILSSLFFSICILVTTMLYLTWSPVGDVVVAWLQGRYFIAISILLLLMLYNTKNVVPLDRVSKLSLYSFSLFSLSITMYSIINRYYIKDTLIRMLALLFLSYVILRLWEWPLSRNVFGKFLEIVLFTIPSFLVHDKPK
jgi:uncharacterized membrane protein